MSLLGKLKKASVLKTTEILSESDFFNDGERVDIGIPAMNIALSGSALDGFGSGLTIFAADSKHFKTNFCLRMVSAFMQKHPNGVCILYDSEFGITPAYLKAMKIDTSRVLHVPITNIEELKFDIAKQLAAIEREDNVIIMIDSVGNLASKKEAKDAEDGNDATDMTRAKALKGLFRIITPHLSLKKIPALVVNHVYQEQKMFPKTIMGGGSGPMLSANNVFFISKSAEKDKDKVLQGFTFKLIVEKSRFVLEKSVVPITVSFDGGIQKWSGMFDIAIDIGWIEQPSSGWYQALNPQTGEIFFDRVRRKDVEYDDAFWNKLFEGGINDAIKERFQLSADKVAQISSQMQHLDDEDSSEEYDENEDVNYENGDE